MEALERIAAYTEGGREAFMRELRVQDATVRNLEIVGEATKSLSPTFRASHPEVSWADMTGMRGVLIHRYAAVDLEIVWEVVENRVSCIRGRILALLEPPNDT